MFADRLVKALIHRNIAGEGVRDLLAAMDAAWQRNAALGVFQPTAALAGDVRGRRPTVAGPKQPAPSIANGELTVDWQAVAPANQR